MGNGALEYKTVFTVAQGIGRWYNETVSTYLDQQNTGALIYVFKKIIEVFVYYCLSLNKNVPRTYTRRQERWVKQTNLKNTVHGSKAAR